jgi:hypothetical protein
MRAFGLKWDDPTYSIFGESEARACHFQRTANMNLLSQPPVRREALSEQWLLSECTEQTGKVRLLCNYYRSMKGAALSASAKFRNL